MAITGSLRPHEFELDLDTQHVRLPSDEMCVIIPRDEDAPDGANIDDSCQLDLLTQNGVRERVQLVADDQAQPDGYEVYDADLPKVTGDTAPHLMAPKAERPMLVLPKKIARVLADHPAMHFGFRTVCNQLRASGVPFVWVHSREERVRKGILMPTPRTKGDNKLYLVQACVPSTAGGFEDTLNARGTQRKPALGDRLLTLRAKMRGPRTDNGRQGDRFLHVAIDGARPDKLISLSGCTFLSLHDVYGRLNPRLGTDCHERIVIDGTTLDLSMTQYGWVINELRVDRPTVVGMRRDLRPHIGHDRGISFREFFERCDSDAARENNVLTIT